MMRKLVAFLTAAILISMPLAANALGFGSLKLNSSLNEPLSAEIELLSATSADVSGLSVKLASSDAFLRAGIDRPALLGELKFAIKQRDNGDYYILVSSKSPVREPFLNFLLEMNWQNGRMLREYTMLLDPPTQVRKQPAVVEEPPVAAPAELAQQEAVEPAASPFVEAPPEPVVVEAAPEAADVPVAETAAVAAAATVLSEEGEVVEPVAEEAPLVVEEAQVAEPLPEDLPVLGEDGAISETTYADMPAEAEPVAAEEVAVVTEEGQVVEAEAALAAAAVPVLSEEGDVVEVAPEDVPVVAEEVAVEEEAAPAEAAIFADDAALLPSIPLTAYMQEPQVEEAYQPAGELDYGIVRKGDNLWTIAEKLRPDDSISIYQVMMALLQSNPDAFVDGNVNRLKVGHVLRIEDASLLTAMSQKEAALEFQAQTEAWEGYRQQVAETTAAQPIIASEVDMGEVAEADTAGELTLASPEGSELQAGAGVTEEAVSNDVVTLQDELRQVRRDAGIMRGRNNELNSKLQELEEELSRLQRSITIKDDELASLQQQLAELQQQPMIEETPAAAMEEPVQAAAEPEPVPAPVEPVAEAMPAEPAAIAEPEPAAEVAAAMPAETAVVEEEPVKPTPPPAPPVTAAPIQPVPQPEEGFLDTALNTVMGVVEVAGDTLSGLFGNMVGDSLLIFIALPVLLVLVILVLIMVRRRRKAGQPYQESILTGGPASVTGAEAAAEESEEESSFLSDFAVSGAGAIQTGDSEVDPLTEADVFMAYGRYEAAEERLAEAIKSEPNRPELKMKLLELFHATKNKPSFENTAEAFYASLGDDARSNPMWQKVAAMGAELVPGNPLFGAAGGGADLPDMAASQDPGMNLSDSQVLDIGLDTGVFDAADTGTPAPAEQAGGMDFNLDVGGGDTVTPASAEAATPAAAEEPGGLDFSLDMADSASEEAAPTPEMAEDSGSLDFDLDLGGGAEPESESGTAEMEFNMDMADEDETASFDLGASLESGTETMPEPSLGEDDTASFSMEGIESAPEPTADDLALDIGSDDLDIGGGGDEVGTKLDLAKAYIDMGDPDGARSILDEVMAEGDDSQKSEAQSLLDQIA
jgi:pilus assembly protein FimV